MSGSVRVCRRGCAVVVWVCMCVRGSVLLILIKLIYFHLGFTTKFDNQAEARFGLYA